MIGETCDRCHGNRALECARCSPRPPAAPIGVIIFAFVLVMLTITGLIVVGVAGL